MVRPSLCTVMSLAEDGSEIGYGSGFVTGPGELITNAHVVAKANSVRVECSGRRGDAIRVVRRGIGIDLVVLETMLQGLHPARLGSSSVVKPGAVVFVLGNPYGLDNTITTGLVSGMRTIEGGEYLQLSADINPGNSGGPVVDSSGLVIGVATMGLLRSQGLNFAVPIEALSTLDRVSLRFDEIKRNETLQREILQRSELAFRGIPLGSSCSDVNTLEHVSTRGAIVGHPELGFQETSTNPHGDFWRLTRLLGEVVKTKYECRHGLLVGGAYVEVPIKLKDRVQKVLEMKYGSPTISSERGLGLLELARFKWSPGPGQRIELDSTGLVSFSVSYVDLRLLEMLEHKESLKAIADEVL